jgi:hypothetical protein
MIERCSSKVTRQVETPSPSCPSTLRRTTFDCRSSANGTTAVTHRSPDELRTICTVTLGPLKRKQMPVYAHELLWIPRPVLEWRNRLSKNFSAAARARMTAPLKRANGPSDTRTCSLTSNARRRFRGTCAPRPDPVRALGASNPCGLEQEPGAPLGFVELAVATSPGSFQSHESRTTWRGACDRYTTERRDEFMP